MELNLSQKSVELLTFALLDSCASNMPKAIKGAAREALAQACSAGPLKVLTPALASRASHKNKDVAEASLVYLEKAMAGMTQSTVKSIREKDLGRIFSALNHGVNAKSPAAKKSARAVCISLCASLGKQEYSTRISKVDGLSSMQIGELQQIGTVGQNAKGAKKGGSAKSADAARKAQMKALREKVSVSMHKIHRQRQQRHGNNCSSEHNNSGSLTDSSDPFICLSN